MGGNTLFLPLPLFAAVVFADIPVIIAGAQLRGS
jgi:hypothetical protein